MTITDLAQVLDLAGYKNAGLTGSFRRILVIDGETVRDFDLVNSSSSERKDQKLEISRTVGLTTSELGMCAREPMRFGQSCLRLTMAMSLMSQCVRAGKASIDGCHPYESHMAPDAERRAKLLAAYLQGVAGLDPSADLGVRAVLKFDPKRQAFRDLRKELLARIPSFDMFLEQVLRLWP